MNTAFEITVDDVQNVIRYNTGHCSYEHADKVFDDIISLNTDEIEKAALYGQTLEIQTEYAYSKMAEILKEEGII